MVNAWITCAGGKHGEALRPLREAADHEDGTEKSAVTPGPIIPVRGQFADLLTAMKQPREALAEYERASVKEPNRFRCLYGAAPAAAAIRDAAATQKYWRQLLAGANNPQAVHEEAPHAMQYPARR